MNIWKQLVITLKSIKNMNNNIIHRDNVMILAAKILDYHEVDTTDIGKYSYLLESLVYHMSRQVDEDMKHDMEGLIIKGVNNEDTLLDNVQKLELGQEVKNYKVLCGLLNQPEAEGNSRKAQLIEFQRFFEYQKVGQKFVITDVYDEPLPKEDRRRLGNNNIYIKYIEVILLRYLSEQKNYTCILKKSQIWNLLGMTSSKYGNTDHKTLEKLDYGITKFEINHFYQRCNQRLERILFTALNNLKNRCLLSYEEQVMIVDCDNIYFKASDNDIRRIDAVKKSALDSMGLISVVQVYCKFKSKEFYDIINERLNDLYGWKYTFKQYKLIYTHEIIVEEIPKSEVELHRLTLNEKVIENINNNAETLYSNQMDKWNEAYQLAVDDFEKSGFGLWRPSFDDVKDENGKKIWMYPSYYLEAQRRLAEELLRIEKRKDFDLMTSGEQIK